MFCIFCWLRLLNLETGAKNREARNREAVADQDVRLEGDQFNMNCSRVSHVNFVRWRGPRSIAKLDEGNSRLPPQDPTLSGGTFCCKDIYAQDWQLLV